MSIAISQFMKPFLTAVILLFCVNSGYSKTDPSPELLERLETFNKLYGYVKYFHPSDEAANLDWDAFSIYGVEQILKSENKEKTEQDDCPERKRKIVHPCIPRRIALRVNRHRTI